MDYLYLDIETIPSQKESVKSDILTTIKPPGNIKKPEPIQNWMDGNAADAAEEKWLKTALDGSKGEIISISWAFNDGDVQSNFRNQGESEKEMVATFYDDIMAKSLDDNVSFLNMPRVIHGSKDLFDLRFLYQRSVILQVKPSFNLHQDSRYNGDYTFDTMTAWAGWGNYCSLESMCIALGIGSPKNGMSGSDVWPEFKKGNIAGIVKYNQGDVIALREVYKRLIFS